MISTTRSSEGGNDTSIDDRSDLLRRRRARHNMASGVVVTESYTTRITTTSPGEIASEKYSFLDESMSSLAPTQHTSNSSNVDNKKKRTKTALDVQKDESRVSKIFMRIVFGSCMFAVFASIVSGIMYLKWAMASTFFLILLYESLMVLYSFLRNQFK